MPAPVYGKIRATVVKLEPIDPGVTVPPNNSLFADSTHANAFTNKDNVGTNSAVATSTSDATLKAMQSGYPGTIPPYTPVSKLANGKIVPADSDAADGQAVCGITHEAFASLNDIKLVRCPGPNVANALVGLGYACGDEVFLGETGGYTNDPSTFSGLNDSIIKIGVADCAAGAASATVTDLILWPDVVARPA